MDGVLWRLLCCRIGLGFKEVSKGGELNGLCWLGCGRRRSGKTSEKRYRFFFFHTRRVISFPTPGSHFHFYSPFMASDQDGGGLLCIKYLLFISPVGKISGIYQNY